MTILSTITKQSFECNGSLREFDFTFTAVSVDDIKALILNPTGVETELTALSQYSVTLNPDGSGGTLTTVATWATGNTLIVYRVTDHTQETEYKNNRVFDQNVLENDLDKMIMIAQETDEKVNRALIFPMSDPVGSVEMPSVSSRANRFLAFDADGELTTALSLVLPVEGHDKVTVSAPLSITDQAIKLVNDADATVTAIDTGVVADSDTVIPTSKAVKTAIAAIADAGVTFATASEITTGTEAAKAVAPDQLALTKYNGDWSFWGIKNLRLIDAHAGDATRVIVNPSAYNIPLLIGEHWHVMTAGVDVDSVDDLDTGSLAAGTDYYIYACTDGTTLSFKVSANATNPTGFDAAHSRKIGGFHTLCAAVGIIAGHALSGYAQKDILPASIWDLKHRAKNLVNVGLVYDSKIQKWVDIYLASGTGANTTSVNGGTISDTRNWMDFVDDGLAVGKRLLTDTEFTSIATGSNEETNITGSADPGTTGGHVDTAGRRMISNIGCEDCCGVVWQWLQDQAYIYSSTTGYWGNLPGGKGSVYTQFKADPGAAEVDNSDNGGDVKLIAGGNWSNAANAGSRSRATDNIRWKTSPILGARFAVEPL